MEFGWESFMSDQQELDVDQLFPDFSLQACNSEEGFGNASLFQASEHPVHKPLLSRRHVASTEPSVMGGDVAASAEEGFVDWMDLKMDLSLLEDLEGPFTALDDLLRGEVTMGQSLDLFLDPFEVKEATNILSQEYPLHEDCHAGIHAAPSSLLVDFLSPPATPPSSPEGLVPDLGLNSSASTNSPISEPSSPSCSSPLTPCEAVFTFIAPIIQSIPLSDVASTTLSVNCPNIPGMSGLTLIIEQPSVEIPLPSVEEKTKKVRKRKSPDTSGNGLDRKKASGERAPTNKRERKRMQNKDAATRYRVKKKVQADVLLDDEEGLRKVNTELKEKKDKLTSEISYLKELMREMFKARGLLK